MIRYLCFFLALVAAITALPTSWDNQRNLDVSFIEEREVAEALSELAKPLDRVVTLADFLKVPFNPDTDDTDRLLYEAAIADPSFHSARAASIRMNYYMDVPTYDRLHAESLKNLLSVAAAMKVPVKVTNSYSSILAEIDEAVRKQEGAGKASFAELGQQLTALHSSSYLFDGRYTIMAALQEDVVAHNAVVLGKSIQEAVAWLRNYIMSNRCSWCKTFVAAVRTQACTAAATAVCNTLATAAGTAIGGVLGPLISKFLCGQPINLAGILGGWCSQIVNHMQNRVRVSDTCLCSFKAYIKIPQVEILGNTFGGFSIGNNSQICKTNPGECAWHSKKDKKKWNGTSATAHKPKSFAGKVTEAIIQGGVKVGADGLTAAAKKGFSETVKELSEKGAKELAKTAAMTAAKTASSATVKTTVNAAGMAAKSAAAKKIDSASKKSSVYAAKMYKKSATERMKEHAAQLRGKARKEYLRRERAEIAARAKKIRNNVYKVANYTGNGVVNMVVDTATTTINSKADKKINSFGKKPDANGEKKVEEKKEPDPKPTRQERNRELKLKALNFTLNKVGKQAALYGGKYIDKVGNSITQDSYAKPAAVRRAARRAVSGVRSAALRAAKTPAGHVKPPLRRAGRTASRTGVGRAANRALDAAVRRANFAARSRSAIRRSARRAARRNSNRRRVIRRRIGSLAGPAALGKMKGLVPIVSSDADLKAKIAKGVIRVGAKYRRGGHCYELKQSSGKSVRTFC